MRTLLGDIAEIRTGIFARPEPEGDVVYLQLRHFDQNGVLPEAPAADLKSDEWNSRHRLRPGEVLFAAKGFKNFAAVFAGDFPAVASSTFLVIRIHESTVLPDYLAWVLNSPPMQEFLKHQAIGSAMVSISKAVLRDLEIIVPPIEKQRKILEISRLSNLERDLRLKIAELRREMVQQQITNAIK